MPIFQGFLKERIGKRIHEQEKMEMSKSKNGNEQVLTGSSTGLEVHNAM